MEKTGGKKQIENQQQRQSHHGPQQTRPPADFTFLKPAGRHGCWRSGCGGSIHLDCGAAMVCMMPSSVIWMPVSSPTFARSRNTTTRSEYRTTSSSSELMNKIDTPSFPSDCTNFKISAFAPTSMPRVG